MQIFHNMTLDDLKTGMIVTMRNGSKYTVLRDIDVPFQNNKDLFIYVNFNQSKCFEYIDDDLGRGYMRFDTYESNLKHVSNSQWDIVKVERSSHPYGFMDLTYDRGSRTIIWTEPTAVKLTVAEIEARLGYKVEIVSD